MRKLTLLLLSAGAFLSSILIVPLLPGGAGNLIIADMLFILAIGLTVLKNTNRPIALGRTSVNVATVFTSFIALGFVSYVLAQFKFTPNFGEFITLLNYLYGLLIALAVAINVEEIADLKVVLRGWIAGAILMSLVSTLAILGAAPDWAYHGNRISSTMRSVNQVQSYLGPAMIMMLYMIYLRNEGLWKLISLCALPFVFIGMLATGSRSPIIIMAVIFCFALIKAVREMRSSPALSGITFGIAGAFIFVLTDVLISIFGNQATILPEGLARPLDRAVRKFVSMGEGSDLVEALGPRGGQFALVLEHWHENPVFGIGPGNFQNVMQHTHEVHNTYFGVFMEHGLVGFALFSLALALMLRALAQIGRGPFEHAPIAGVLLGAFLIVLFYAASSFGIRQRTFWIMVGLTLGICRLNAFVRQRASFDVWRPIQTRSVDV